jgi:hypothetical protein
MEVRFKKEVAKRVKMEPDNAPDRRLVLPQPSDTI